MNTTLHKPHRLYGIGFRILAVLFSAAGLLFLQGLSEGLEPWIRSFMASSPLPDELRFHAAVHGALIGILFSFALLAMLKDPYTKPLLLHFYFIGHLIFLGTLLVTDPSLAGQTVFVFGMFAVVLASLYGVYPLRKEIFRPSQPSSRNRTLLLMTAASALWLLPVIVNSVLGQVKDPEPQFRWGEGAALALTLLYAGWLTASSRAGARTLAVIQSLAYLYLGAASLTLPDHPGSWGLWGGLASIAYGLLYSLVVFYQYSTTYPATEIKPARN